ncbi:hypothetical protein RE428_01700 [Marinobacter nanhaiticus D15-8W]|uniref:GlyGly-CTERM sorting domain-containing protein n=1 Tax=Marinobacter nanhaiticus D15-8W TaxID=626887 RepID=N6W4S1_9GAMM|nr:hypothetical protein [Marinobacter nanhaiticus]ENO15149.1 hypothetical protein J057_07361 [Marinobacter nanhaiticus D15-8W]BES69152.1 hypothetical protein RE428_01700 [Marinobacter nanhaiticus D15-8W]
MKGTFPRAWSCAAILYLLTSAAANAAPDIPSLLPEGFESTLPAYLVNDPASQAAWYVDSTQSQAGAQSLRSGDIGNDQMSAITLSGALSAGTLSFDYLALTQSCCDRLEIQVNGKRFNFRSTGETGEWQQADVILPDASSTVTFVYRKDEAASAGADAIWIDNLDFIPTIDTGSGPLDTDGDGLTDDQENGYDALDPYNADDAAEDYDGDRVTNYSEVLSGYDPDVQNVFPLHNGFDFYPLGEIAWTYTIPDRPTLALESEAITEKVGRFRLSNSDTYDVIERSTNGIHLVEHGFTDDSGSDVRLVYTTPKLILPDGLRMGVQYEWSGDVERWIKGKPEDEATEHKKTATYREHLELEAVREMLVDFQGKSHQGVVVSTLVTRTNEASEITREQRIRLYVEGLGLFHDEGTGRSLESINIQSLDTESRADVELEDTLPESSGDSGSGSMPSLLIGALLLLVLGRRLRA